MRAKTKCLILNSIKILICKMLLLLLHLITSAMTSPPELRLRNDLMHDYNPLERPVERSEDPVVVTLGVIFQQIIDLVIPLFNFNSSKSYFISFY